MYLRAQRRTLRPGHPSISVIDCRNPSMPHREGESLAGSTNGILPKACHGRRNLVAMGCGNKKARSPRAVGRGHAAGPRLLGKDRQEHTTSPSRFRKTLRKSSGRSQSGEIVDLSVLPATVPQAVNRRDSGFVA